MPQPNALVGLADYKEWHPLGNTSTALDAVLKTLIDASSDDIQRFCRRIFRKGTITDEPHDGTGSRTLRLRRPPIWSVSAVKIDGAPLDPASYVVPRLASDADAEVDFNDGRVVLLARTFPVGTRNVLVSYV